RFEQDLLEENDVFTSVAVDTTPPDSTIVWAGTRDGVYKFIFTDSDSADTVFHYLSSDLIETKVILSIGIQRYDDQKAVWLAGYTYLGHHPPPHSVQGIAYKTTDGGETWNSYLDFVPVRDFAFSDSTVWAATHEGLKRSRDGGQSWDTFEVVDSASGQLIIPSRFASVCIVPGIVDTTILVGSIDGLARSTDDGVFWNVTKFAHSFKKAIWAGSAAGIYKFIYNYRDDFDTVLNYNSYLHNITGDWVVSLAIQQYQAKKVMWAGTQPTYSGSHGASFSTDDGDTWNTTLLGDRVWNFAFDDTVIWTATSSGLKRSDDWGDTWEVFNHMKD
ncbi:MAG: hypothetical protein GTO40_00010, partial [Deltaproteobacteria bacterium]|nr:hypothetical protein [Deltaproteobacteria bacterium]